MDSFLAIAEELQLKGLMGKSDEKVQYFEVDEKYVPRKVSPVNASSQLKEGSIKKTCSKIQNTGQKGTLAIPGLNFYGDFVELEERVKSMMEKSENNYANQGRKADRCKVCGKEGMSNAIKDHIEANHLEGVVIPCNLCDNTFRSRDSLRQHHKRQHKN